MRYFFKKDLTNVLHLLYNEFRKRETEEGLKMRVKINNLNKQLEKKDLEKFTRKLYIYRQKDRPKDEGGNGMKNQATKISKKDFEAYVRVQRSGVTNMFAVDLVSKLSGLTRDKILYIMENYRELSKKFKIIRD